MAAESLLGAAGPAEGFSLAAGDDLHFVTLSATCATPAVRDDG